MMRFNRPIAALFLGTCLAAGRAGWGAEILLLSRFPPPGPNYAWPDDPLVRLLEAQGHQVDTSFMGVSLGSLHFNRPLIDAVNGADVIVVSPAAPIAIHTNYADACAVSSSGSVSEVDFSLIPHVARPILRMDTYSGSNLPLTSQSRTDVVIHDPDHPFVAQLGQRATFFDWQGPNRGVEATWRPTITLRDASTGAQTTVIASYDGRPFLTETADTSGTGAFRRAYLGNWNYGSAGSNFEEFVTEDYQRVLLNVVDQLASSNLGGGPPAYTPPTSGDLNGNGIHDAGDIDLLTQHVLEGTGDLRFDLNGDLVVNYEDQRVLVEERFKTWRGDSNLDGVFDTSDFVQVFQRGKFETGQQAGWSEGDWSGDFRFDTADFVWAFQSGDYCKGPRAAVAGVPEPSGTRILGLLVMLLGCCKRRRDQGNATVPTNAAGGLPTCWARPSVGS